MSDDNGFLPTGLRFSAIREKKDTDILLERIEKLEAQEAHINKLHEMINMEDRITAGDVLKRLTLIEGEIKEINRFHDVTLAQYRINHIKKPHKCPVCDGNGIMWDITNKEGLPWPGSQKIECKSCEGKGIVWG